MRGMYARIRCEPSHARLRGKTVHAGPRFEVPKASRTACNEGQAHDERPLYIESDIKTNQKLPITSDQKLTCWPPWRACR